MSLLDLFNQKYPSTDFHELNLDWCITAILQLQKAFEDFSAGNKLIFADPLQHDLTKTYAKNTIVVDPVSGTAYLSLDVVPKGVQLDNASYWLPVFDFAGYVTRANQNFTDNYFSGTDRSPIPLAVGDWVVLDDVLYKVTQAIAADDLFIIGTNIVHFTIEQFLKDFVTAINQTVLQYKNDIDASEYAYRQQLAQDIANTTASLQAQLDLAISGATVDSEVINARLGADGHEYTTLGNAIRGQIENLDRNIENLQEAINISTDYFPLVFVPGYYTTDAVGETLDIDTINYRTDYVCTKIAVSEGDRIVICGDGYSGQRRLYAIVDSSDECIELASASLSGYRELIMPENADYIVINILTSSSVYYAYKGLSVSDRLFTNHSDNVILRRDTGSGEALGIILYENVLDGVFEEGYFNSSGEPSSNSSYYRTVNYIPCEPDTTYYRNDYSKAGCVVYYDINKNIIADRTTGVARYTLSANDNESFVTPIRAAYMKFGLHYTNYTNISISRIRSGVFTPYNVKGYNFSNNAMFKAITSAVDKSSQISWITGKRADPRYPMSIRDNEAYMIARINAKQGDKITLCFNHYVNQVTSLVSEDLGDAFNTLLIGSSDHSILTYQFRVPYDMPIILCSQIAQFVAAYWISDDSLNRDILDVPFKNVKFDANECYKKVVASSGAPWYHASVMQRPLTLLHLSDLHDDVSAIADAARFMTMFGDNVDDCIITGDLVATRFTQYPKAFTADSTKKILLTVGNHDVYDHDGDAEEHGVPYSDPAYWATSKEVYDQMFAPSIDNWNVTQPTNAASLGLCYYYKDYDITGDSQDVTVSTIRLIVLDCMYYDSDQATWLTDTLADARTNGIPVLIAEHYPPTEERTYTHAFDTNFFMGPLGMEREYGNSLTVDSVSAMDLVDNFITAGGEFVCWLCGHLHYAIVDTLPEHPNQIYIAIESAAVNNVYCDVPRKKDTSTEYLMNLFSVDTYLKTIRIQRIGAEYDRLGRHRGSLTINYQTRELITTF